MAAIVHHLQCLIHQELSPNAHPCAELIGSCWSSQASSNFVLTFSGQPSNDDILSLWGVFLDFFGPGSLLYPTRDYTWVLFNLVLIPSMDPLPSLEDLKQELGLNPVC